MTSSRKIEAPGIELREDDRSGAAKEDYSLQEAPVCLVTGLASKGEDYTVQWINSINTLETTFGIPSTEPETWFYNGVREILDRGGIALAAKLPYDNGSFGRYAFKQYKISAKPIQFGSSIDFDAKTLRECHDMLDTILKKYGRSDDISNPNKMWKAVCSLLATQFAGLSLDEIDEPRVKDLVDSLRVIVKSINDNPLNLLYYTDNQLTSCMTIEDCCDGYDTLDNLDHLLTGSRSTLKNSMRIYDISRTQYQAYDLEECVTSLVEDDSERRVVATNDCLGIIPVVTTAANAMWFQNILSFSSSLSSTSESSMSAIASFYNPVHGFGTILGGSCKELAISSLISTDFSNLSSFATKPMASNSIDEDSVSKDTVSMFPEINWRDHLHLENDTFKKIGIVVLQAYKDTANGNHMSFKVLEAFTGTLDKTSKDQLTHSSMFIDDVVNSRSRYIRVFSNADRVSLQQASTIVVKNQTATSLGFYKVQCRKLVNCITTIQEALSKILESCRDPNSIPLDLIVDAGVSNLAQLAWSVGGSTHVIDFDKNPRISDFEDLEDAQTDSDFKTCTCGSSGKTGSSWTLSSVADTMQWRAVMKKIDDFIKYVRRDCMYLADGLRTFCLEGDEKLVRRTKPSSSVRNTLLPRLKFIADSINSSYSAGWANWFLSRDYYTDELFWCPPSIKAASSCILCDTYYHTWDAPAGMERGVVQNVVDVAFSPSSDEAGKIYVQKWNYAISYPLNGIVLEGQKTFQTEKTSLDRINVRRGLIDLEKKTIEVGRRFVYEKNTEWLRQSFVDELTPIFDDAVSGDCLSDYAIKCDDEINTEQTIDNHELHCKIAVKFIKTIEWIVLDFILTKQSANVSEEILR